MRWFLAILVATMLLIPYVPADASSDGPIGISSVDEFLDIGIGSPSDGDYILTEDLIFPSTPSLSVSFSVDSDAVVVWVTADGYAPTEDVAYLEVVMNDQIATVNGSTPNVSFPLSKVNEWNPLYVMMDGMEGTVLIGSDTIMSEGTVEVPTGSNMTRKDVVFTGTLDGAGHRISGIVMNGENVCMFSGSDGATFRNIVIEGSFSSYIHHNPDAGIGRISFDETCTASPLVERAKDTVFERIHVDSDVISFMYSTSEVGQGAPEDPRLLGTDCIRESVSGGITAYSSGCDYIACTSAGKVASCIGSVVSMDTTIEPSTLDTCSDTGRNISGTLSGGLCASSENDRFASCSSIGRSYTVTVDGMSIVPYPTTDSFDSVDRVQSYSVSGGLAGRMVGSHVHGCDDSHIGAYVNEVELNVPGTSSDVRLSGSLTGSSTDCEIMSCRISGDIVSGDSIDDTIEDVSDTTTLPDRSFKVTLDNDGSVIFEGVGKDGMITMDHKDSALDCIIGTDATVELDNGSAYIGTDRIVLNPEFDWVLHDYKDMCLEVRASDGPMSPDLIVLIVACVCVLPLIAAIAISLRKF